MKITTVTGIQCPWCQDKIWSRHIHDFRYCECGYCAIDGGRHYISVSYGGADWPEPWCKPETVTLEVPVVKEPKDTFPY